MVIEAPPGLLGGISDLWQREILGIGPTGADKGKGGKFLLLPPDHDGTAPEGYLAAKSRTFGAVFGVRGFQSNGTAKAVTLIKTTRIYPLSKAANPPAPTFFNGSRNEVDTIFSDTGQYFDDLAWLIEREPHDTLPSHERFQLAAIGIEKGKPFAPDAARRGLFEDAARFGSAIARTNSFASDDAARLVYPDRVWEWAFIGGSADWDSQGFVNTDRRASFAYIAIGMSPAMVEKHIGTGSQYLWTPRDASGASRRRQTVSPARSAGYPGQELLVARGLRSGDARSSSTFDPPPRVEQLPKPQKNADGSVDLYLGPKAPAGKETNWIQTVPGRLVRAVCASTRRPSRSSTRRGSSMTSCN